MSNQLEEDLRRVLGLARAEARARQRKTGPKGATSIQQREPEQRHRHDRHLTGSRKERSTLLQAKLQGLSAIYGIENTSRHLGDCGTKSVLSHRHQNGTEEDEEVLQQRLSTRRALYKQHYAGALAAASGRKRELEHLLEAAAHQARASRAMGAGIGAAILTTSHTIHAASAVESGATAICAERAVVFKILTSGTPMPTIEALAICSEQQEMLPFPCGACREFLADCGDFPVYLVNALGESEETRSTELFPRARHTELTQRLARPQSAMAPRMMARIKSSAARADQVPMEVKDWTTEHVLQWLVKDVELPQYCEVFERNAVDGCTLVLLEASDLQLLLGITHPLHRSKLLTHLDRLRDRELLARGLDYTQLEDYLAVLDIDRVSAVARLKTTFDNLDSDRDGYLDFVQVKQALSRLRCTIPARSTAGDNAENPADSGSVEASAQTVERLLHSGELFGKEAASSGKVSFPAFASAFSKLAMQPADTPSVTQGAFAVHALGPRLPVLDLPSLRSCYEQQASHTSDDAADTFLGEAGLVQLLQDLGQTQSNSLELARQWLQVEDEIDEASEVLSVAQFITRYTQLMDATANESVEATSVIRLQQLFTSYEPVHSTRWKPRSVVQRALSTLFPAVPGDEINVWCAANWPAKPVKGAGITGQGHNRTRQTLMTLNFPEFTLACLEFAVEVYAREQEAASIKYSLRNDALAHHSRVVHLHQSGHVRMCPQTSEDAAARTSTMHPPQAQQEKRYRIRSDEDDDGKHSDRDGKARDTDEDDDRQAQRRRKRERQVDKVFDRFAQRHTKCGSRPKEDDGKQSSDDEEDAGSMLNAVEAAQAALELGAAFSREQMLRYLEREGLGRLRRRDVSRSAFQRLIKRLDANQTQPRDFLLEIEDYSASGKKHEADASKGKAHVSGRSLRHHAYKSRLDYDEFLRQKRALQNGSRWEKEVDELRRKQLRRGERRQHKLHKKRHHRSRHRESDDDGKHDSDTTSSESSASSVRIRRRHKAARATRSRSRSKNTRSRRGRRRSRSSSSERSTATDTSSNDSEQSAIRRRGRPRGFEPGARVASMIHGRGTIERVYKDYFVADVHFDTGRRIRNVEFAGLRVLDPEDEEGDSVPKRGFIVGSLVSIPHKGTKTRRRGKIVLCRTDGTFDVLVNEFGQAQMLKRIARSALELANVKQTVYREGARVMVKQRTEYLRGRVCACHTNGSYDVKLARPPHKVLQRLAPELLSPDDEDDGDSDVDVDVTERDSPRAPKVKSPPKKEDSDDDFEPEFSRGDRVEARFGGQAAYYPGTIERVYPNGTCDISYDDGDEEERVATRLIRALPRTTEARKPTTTTKAKPGNGSDGYESDFFESD